MMSTHVVASQKETPHQQQIPGTSSHMGRLLCSFSPCVWGQWTPAHSSETVAAELWAAACCADSVPSRVPRRRATCLPGVFADWAPGPCLWAAPAAGSRMFKHTRLCFCTTISSPSPYLLSGLNVHYYRHIFQWCSTTFCPREKGILGVTIAGEQYWLQWKERAAKHHGKWTQTTPGKVASSRRPLTPTSRNKAVSDDPEGRKKGSNKYITYMLKHAYQCLKSIIT